MVVENGEFEVSTFSWNFQVKSKDFKPDPRSTKEALYSSENQQNSKNEKLCRIQSYRSLRVFGRFQRSRVFCKVRISKFLFNSMKLQNEIFTSSVSEEKRSMLFSFFKNSKNKFCLQNNENVFFRAAEALMTRNSSSFTGMTQPALLMTLDVEV